MPFVICNVALIACIKGMLHFFLEIGSFYHSPKVTVELHRFQMHSDYFLIFRSKSVTRQFLLSLTSIVEKKYGSQWDQKLSDILLNINKNRLNTFENSKTQLFNSGGVVKWVYFQKKKKVEYPFKCNIFYIWLQFQHLKILIFRYFLKICFF